MGFKGEMIEVINEIIKLSDSPKGISFKGQEYLLSVKYNKGISKEKVRGVAISYDLVLSQAFIEFYESFDGIRFFEYSDCKFYSIQEIIRLSKKDEEAFSNKLIQIGNFFGDYILMDCSDEENSVLYSIEGIDTPISTGLGFERFMEVCLENDLIRYWDTWES